MITLPPITITKSDSDRLSRFLEKQFTGMTQVTLFLEKELERAHVVESQDVSSDVVQFRMESDGLSRTHSLVYPGEADLLNGRLSILTPVGVALLGLSVGQTMPWENRAGAMNTLKIERILYQPEADSRFDL
jgi:regulator of nucleoside diphosphate kinase